MKTEQEQQHFLLGIDVGGTKTEVAVAVTGEGILETVVAPTNTSSAEALVHGIRRVIDQVLNGVRANVEGVAAVGVGVPGQVNPQEGVVHLAVNLNLENYPLAQALSRQMNHLPVVVENDVRLAAVGVYRYLQQHEAVESVAYLSIGTGIAAGLVREGSLYRGSTGMAGEIGHIVVEPDGEPCLCGLRGCLETVAAGPAISRQAAAFLGQGEQLPATAEVYKAAQAGNVQAQELVERVSTFLARAIHWLAMSYDPQLIVLGGGVTRANEAFWQPIRTELARLRTQSPLARKMLAEERILLLPPGMNPGVWGALALAQQAAQKTRSTSDKKE